MRVLKDMETLMGIPIFPLDEYKSRRVRGYTGRGKDSTKAVLHRSNCGHISGVTLYKGQGSPKKTITLEKDLSKFVLFP